MRQPRSIEHSSVDSWKRNTKKGHSFGRTFTLLKTMAKTATKHITKVPSKSDLQPIKPKTARSSEKHKPHYNRKSLHFFCLVLKSHKNCQTSHNISDFMSDVIFLLFYGWFMKMTQLTILGISFRDKNDPYFRLTSRYELSKDARARDDMNYEAIVSKNRSNHLQVSFQNQLKLFIECYQS